MLESEDSIVERFDFERAGLSHPHRAARDYLAHLEGLKGRMPSITQNRMRLARMTGDQALAAVIKPGGSSSPRKSPNRSCASSRAAPNCATPRSSRRSSLSFAANSTTRASRRSDPRFRPTF